MANEGAKPDEFDVLCRQIGLALITWQDVETAHFRIFFKLLGAPEYSLASIVYHQNESFDARHTMVLRLVQHSLKGQPELLKLWDDGKIGLYKNVKDANLNRNKLAHYTHEFMVSSIEKADDGGAIVRFDQPRLQPSPYNMVSRLLGRTPEGRPQSECRHSSDLCNRICEVGSPARRILGEATSSSSKPEPWTGSRPTAKAYYSTTATTTAY
jgi:hypothetical protein